MLLAVGTVLALAAAAAAAVDELPASDDVALGPPDLLTSRLREHIPQNRSVITAEQQAYTFWRLPEHSRFWFCISAGKLWLTPVWNCGQGKGNRGFSRGCGVCSMGRQRKALFLRGLQEYMLAYRPRYAVCAVVSCLDTPHGARSDLPAPVLSYTSSPRSLGYVPFPDYTFWSLAGVAQQGWQQLRDGIEASRVPWQKKAAKAVLAFGKVPCARAHLPGFSRGCARYWYQEDRKVRFLQLRHALYFGRCDAVTSSRIRVVNGPTADATTFRRARHLRRRRGGRLAASALVNSSKRPQASENAKAADAADGSASTWLSKVGFCSYRFIVLTTGTSNWLDHTKDALFCGSLVIFVHDEAVVLSDAFDMLTRFLQPGKHYLLIRTNSTRDDSGRDARRALCARIAAAVEWAITNDRAARAIADRGLQLVQHHYSSRDVLGYMHRLLSLLASLQPQREVDELLRIMRAAPVGDVEHLSQSCMADLARPPASRDPSYLHLAPSKRSAIEREQFATWRRCASGSTEAG